jgi:hypothetical protein
MDSFGVMYANLYPTPSQTMLALIGAAGGLLYGYNIGTRQTLGVFFSPTQKFFFFFFFFFFFSFFFRLPFCRCV